MSKEKNFKVSKSKKYFQTHILRFKPGNVTVDVNMSTMNLHQDRESTEKYMKFVLDMENQVAKELKKRKLSHDPMKVVVYSIRMVESWSCGFEVRSDLPIERQSELIVNWFNDNYNEAKTSCESILAELKENPKAYLNNWVSHDKYNRDNKLFELDMEELDQHYGEDPFDKMSDALKKMHELLDEIKEEKK